jgi:hypothetical protein
VFSGLARSVVFLTSSSPVPSAVPQYRFMRAETAFRAAADIVRVRVCDGFAERISTWQLGECTFNRDDQSSVSG